MTHKRNAVIVDVDRALPELPLHRPIQYSKSAVDLINDLALLDYDIILVTGAEAKDRTEMVHALEMVGVPWHHLYTRMDGDAADHNDLMSRFYSDYIAPEYEVRYVITGFLGPDFWFGLGLHSVRVTGSAI